MSENSDLAGTFPYGSGSGGMGVVSTSGGGGGGGGSAKNTVNEKSVNLKLDNLNVMIDTLSKVADSLMVKLDPILTPNANINGSGNKMADSESKETQESIISSKLVVITDRLYLLRRALEGLTQRVEL